MTAKPPAAFDSLLIRSAAAWKPGWGYLLACDPATEEQAPHAKVIACHDGKFTESWVAFGAHSICRIKLPLPGLALVSSEGFYAVFAQQVTKGNLFEDSSPPPSRPRFGSIRSVSQIGGMAYAVGLRGMVYRLDRPDGWTRLDETLPEEADLQAIDGFSESDLYAVGFKGAVWHFDGSRWRRCDLPTNVNLTAVKCAGDGQVYVAGHGGLLARGRGSAWRFIEHDVKSDLWDLEWFADTLYASSFTGAYQLSAEQLLPIDFGSNRPQSFYHLSAGDGVLWSIGEKEVMSFDGKDWTRVV